MISEYWFLIYILALIAVLVVPEINQYKKMKKFPSWSEAVDEMLKNRESEIMFLQSVPELRLFSRSFYKFHQLIKRADFSSAMKDLYDWSLKRMPYRHYNIISGMAILILWLGMLWYVSFVENPSASNVIAGRALMEALGSFVQISGIARIYYFIIRPFIKSAKFVRGKTGLTVRKTENYFPLREYTVLFSVGIVLYFILLYTMPEARFSISVLFAFIHILSLYFFAVQVVEKGAPFDGTKQFGALVNKALLHSTVTEIIRSSLMVIIVHLYIEFFVCKEMLNTLDSFNLTMLLYIFAAMVFIGIRSYFALNGEIKRLEKYLDENKIDESGA